jgi:hypothetical protein
VALTIGRFPQAPPKKGACFFYPPLNSNIMQQTGFEQSHGSHIPAVSLGLWYDAERLVLEGIYLDEVSAYRAKKSWIKSFELNFLLEEIHDFKVKVGFDPESARYHVQCMFTSACGRYAFWRLTHHQAPEVQFALETAHLPHMTTVHLADAVIESSEIDPPAQVLLTKSDTETLQEVCREIFSLIHRKARKCIRRARGLVTRPR